MKLEQMLYMAETEGLTHLVNTETAHLNAIVNEILAWDDETFCENVVVQLFLEYGVPITQKNWNYVRNHLD